MLKLYAVSDEYIRYLRVENNIIHVFDNKEGHRTHDRKYVGVVISIGDYQYFSISHHYPLLSAATISMGKSVRRTNLFFA